jgi:hypothetical protein
VTKNSPSTEMVAAIDEVLAGNTYLCEEVGHLRGVAGEMRAQLRN